MTGGTLGRFREDDARLSAGLAAVINGTTAVAGSVANLAAITGDSARDSARFADKMAAAKIAAAGTDWIRFARAVKALDTDGARLASGAAAFDGSSKRVDWGRITGSPLAVGNLGRRRWR